jgi:hypothetical protein
MVDCLTLKNKGGEKVTVKKIFSYPAAAKDMLNENVR